MPNDLFATDQRRVLHLEPGREKSIRNRHPWVFDGAIARDEGPREAAIADLFAPDDRRVASGFYSPKSQIRFRAISFERELSMELLRERIEMAVGARAHLVGDSTSAVRLVHAEGDGLSGLVADFYAGTLVVEITSAGLEKVREVVLSALAAAAGRYCAIRGVMLENDLHARKLEGIGRTDEWFDGESIRRCEDSDVPEIVIRENGLQFLVRPGKGQKTGFYLDQRDNRALARSIAHDCSVLNVFSYTGGFGVYAAAGGATSVEEIDVSAPAIELARRNHELNVSRCRLKLFTADAFEHLRSRKAAGAKYDLVIVDPPAFAKSRGEIDRAARGYKDINLQAIQLVAPGGHLMTFSCSGHVSIDLFQKIVFGAAADSGRDAAIVRRLGAGEDHPVSLFCPESEYLKGLLIRVR